eukprot:COSAG01_NODE_2105_length_8423_cov_6.483409_8_plen_99_part_00
MSRLFLSRSSFPSCNRSLLTEISPCHACSDQELLRTETAGQEEEGGAEASSATVASSSRPQSASILRRPGSAGGSAPGVVYDALMMRRARHLLATAPQ